jgi:hypothetical protein
MKSLELLRVALVLALVLPDDVSLGAAQAFFGRRLT